MGFWSSPSSSSLSNFVNKEGICNWAKIAVGNPQHCIWSSSGQHPIIIWWSANYYPIIIQSSSDHNLIIKWSSTNYCPGIIQSSSNHHPIIIWSLYDHQPNIIRASSSNHHLIIIQSSSDKILAWVQCFFSKRTNSLWEGFRNPSHGNRP